MRWLSTLFVDENIINISYVDFYRFLLVVKFYSSLIGFFLSFIILNVNIILVFTHQRNYDYLYTII